MESPFERKIDPSTSNAHLIERDLFGRVRDDADGVDRTAELVKYAAELRSAFADPKNRTLEGKDALLEKGYALVESLPREPSFVLDDLKNDIVEGLEEPRRKVEIFSAIGTPLREVLGFSGFAKIAGKHKGAYVPFEHVADPRNAREIAPVIIPALPDRQIKLEEYNQAIHRAGRQILNEWRRVKMKAQMKVRPARWR